MEQISKYIENIHFAHWVFEPDAESERWWKKFIEDNPEEKKNILLARKVLQRFHTKDKNLTEEEKILLFAGILQDVEEKSKSKSVRFIKPDRLSGILKFAAVAVLFFAIGAILFYKQSRFNHEFNNQQFAERITGNSTRLIRTNGENILLKEKNSVLEYQADGKLVVDRDTIKPARLAKSDRFTMNKLIIPYGKTSEVYLSDGTKVYLNAGSQLSYPSEFRGNFREVYLSGEAFFKVSPNPDKPFYVNTKDIKIKVLGTSFNVSSYAEDKTVQTVLVKGKITAGRNELFAKTIELVPGERLTFDKNDSRLLKDKVDVELYSSWKNGYLVFSNEPIYEVIIKLKRFYNKDIAIEAGLDKISFSGKLDFKDNLKEVLENIAFASSVRVQEENESFIIKH